MNDSSNLKNEISSSADLKTCPTFALRADQPGHLHALIAACSALSGDERRAVSKLIREFELYMDAHPERAPRRSTT